MNPVIAERKAHCTLIPPESAVPGACDPVPPTVNYNFTLNTQIKRQAQASTSDAIYLVYFFVVYPEVNKNHTAASVFSPCIGCGIRERLLRDSAVRTRPMVRYLPHGPFQAPGDSKDLR